MEKTGIKLIEKNKKALFDYFVEERFEAGIVLEGNEVKSVKAGHINLRDSYCVIEKDGLELKNCSITPYEKGSVFNAEPLRSRRLLLKKTELNKIRTKSKTKGYTIIPLSVYLKGRLIKLEIALCRGKHTYDKREAIKEKDLKRAAEREMR